MGLAMGRVINYQKEWMEYCPGCAEEARVNEQDMRADKPFKSRYQLLDRCLFELGKVVPMVKSQELAQVLVLSGEPYVTIIFPNRFYYTKFNLYLNLSTLEFSNK